TWLPKQATLKLESNARLHLGIRRNFIELSAESVSSSRLLCAGAIFFLLPCSARGAKQIKHFQQHHTPKQSSERLSPARYGASKKRDCPGAICESSRIMAALPVAISRSISRLSTRSCQSGRKRRAPTT